MPRNLINIIVADSQFLARAGYQYLFAQHAGLNILAEAIDSEELWQSITQAQPDVVVADYANGGLFALEDICRLRSDFPKIQVLLVTDENKKENISKLLDCGVNSILTKNCSQEEIVSAVLASAKGEKFFCNKVLDIILEKHVPKQDESCDPYNLSTREIEIITLIAQGKSTKQIAELLCLSTHTIYTHRKNIMKKLQINSASEMILYAMESGIVKLETT